MADFQIRPACAADCDAIAALWHESWHDAHHELVPACILPDRTLAKFRQRVVALTKDALVADVVAGGKVATIGGFVTTIGDEVAQLFVARFLRGKGCAQSLLMAAEEKLRLAGKHDAQIYSAAGNSRGLAFYRKQGYRDTGISPQPVWRSAGSDEITIPTHLLVKALG